MLSRFGSGQRPGAPVLLPVGVTEQHGLHLPTGVDDFLAAEVCRRTAVLMAERGRPVVVAPSVWCGLSEHHMGFGGTAMTSPADSGTSMRAGSGAA
ncbi:creatininase family protein [Actinomadura napierensis]|uniref:Creatininase family protein n=1 Tax=Actinomadura napierensis TaxID=267854 RepID=A0ABN3ABB4_9ACTN